MFYAYHVVTDRPMTLGQYIRFDETHHSGVYQRVMERLPQVEEIYRDPARFAGVTLDHHLDVALRELALEDVRRENYPQYPSRMSCLYVSQTLGESEDWFAYFTSLGRPTYQIVKLKIDGRVFLGDAAKCFDGTPDREENRRLAARYWENRSVPDERQIVEMLVDGDIEVVEILRDIRK